MHTVRLRALPFFLVQQGCLRVGVSRCGLAAEVGGGVRCFVGVNLSSSSAPIRFFREPLSPIPWSRFSGTFHASPIDLYQPTDVAWHGSKNSTVTNDKHDKTCQRTAIRELGWRNDRIAAEFILGSLMDFNLGVGFASEVHRNTVGGNPYTLDTERIFPRNRQKARERTPGSTLNAS